MNILDEIVTNKRIEIADLVIHQAPSFYTGDVYSRLKKEASEAIKIIAEVKMASPTMGDIRSVNPAKRATLYENAGAAAISVLTDQKYFKGSVQYLQQVADSVSIPALRKDFILEAKQITEARLNGAGMVLLMTHIHDTQEMLQPLVEYTQSLGMEPLIECHSKSMIDLAVSCGGRIIGVNARDFSNPELPIIPARLLDMLPHIPDNCVKVAESGMQNKDDVDQVRELADCVLIGTALMQQPDETLRTFLLDLQNK